MLFLHQNTHVWVGTCKKQSSQILSGTFTHLFVQQPKGILLVETNFVFLKKISYRVFRFTRKIWNISVYVLFQKRTMWILYSRLIYIYMHTNFMRKVYIYVCIQLIQENTWSLVPLSKNCNVNRKQQNHVGKVSSRASCDSLGQLGIQRRERVRDTFRINVKQK